MDMWATSCGGGRAIRHNTIGGRVACLAEAAGRAAATPLQGRALRRCTACGLHLRMCRACGRSGPRYCSDACQAAHWPRHKRCCALTSAARRAAAAAAVACAAELF
eukprot:gene7809-9577_t